MYYSLADPRGGARDARPPWGSKFFHFHAVFGKNVKNNSNFGSWRPPLGKILDPPLLLLASLHTTSFLVVVIANLTRTGSIPTNCIDVEALISGFTGII